MAAARSGQSSFFDANNTTVFGVVTGEVTTETDHVLTSCIGTILAELRRSCLTTHFEEFSTVAGFLSKTTTDNMLQAVLDVAQSRRFANALFENLRRKLTYNHPILEFCFYKAWLDHLTTISNCIIEGERTDGWKHSNIADTHPRKIGFAPITVLAEWMRHVWFTLAHKGKIERNTYTFTMQTINERGRITAVSLINNSTYSDIATLTENIFHFENTIATAPPVMILHPPSVHIDDAWSTVHGLV